LLAYLVFWLYLMPHQLINVAGFTVTGTMDIITRHIEYAGITIMDTVTAHGDMGIEFVGTVNFVFLIDKTRLIL
jgi:hypothetical protein